MADPFSGDVSLGDLKKVFQAHGVKVDDVDLEETGVDGKVQRTRMVKLQKGDLIDVMPADPVFYRGKAHRLARAYGVPIPDLYQPNKFISAKK